MAIERLEDEDILCYQTNMLTEMIKKYKCGKRHGVTGDGGGNNKAFIAECRNASYMSYLVTS